jgi:DNA-binding CsgD family transcriptional regulator
VDHSEGIRYRCGEGKNQGTELDLGQVGVVTACLRLGKPASVDGIHELARTALGKLLQARRLFEQLELLRGALDTTTSAIILFNSDTDIVYANPPADELLSRQTEDGLVVQQSGTAPVPLFTFLCSMVEQIVARPQSRSSWNGNLNLSDETQLACEIIAVAVENGDRHLGVLMLLQPINPLPQWLHDDFKLAHQLSPREEEVMDLIVEGLTAQEIGVRLSISPHTVRDHVKHLYRKTGTSSRTELLALVARSKLGASR